MLLNFSGFATSFFDSLDSCLGESVCFYFDGKCKLAFCKDFNEVFAAYAAGVDKFGDTDFVEAFFGSEGLEGRSEEHTSELQSQR